MDRISNMLTTIKNAIRAEKPFIEVVYTAHAEKILKVIQDKGFIKSVKVFKPEGSAFKKLRIDFEYDGTMALLDDIKIISKPGRRVYKSADELRRVSAGYGVQIVSTSRGVMSSEDAKKKKLGGEVICEVR